MVVVFDSGDFEDGWAWGNAFGRTKTGSMSRGNRRVFLARRTSYPRKEEPERIGWTQGAPLTLAFIKGGGFTIDLDHRYSSYTTARLVVPVLPLRPCL